MSRKHYSWDFKVGPAAVLTFISMVVQVVVVVWVGSSIYTGLTNKVDYQSSKIADVEKGSDKRFETVVSSIKDARTKQDETIQRVTKLEAALTFIGESIHRVELAVQPVKR